MKWKTDALSLEYGDFEVWARHSSRTAGLGFGKRSEIHIWHSSA